MRLLVSLGVTLVLARAPAPLTAQVPLLDKVFSKVNSVAVTLSYVFAPRNLPDSRPLAFNAEVVLLAGRAGCVNLNDFARIGDGECSRRRARSDSTSWYRQYCEARRRRLDRALETAQRDKLARFGAPADSLCSALAAGEAGELLERTVRHLSPSTTVTERFAPGTKPEHTGPIVTFELALGLTYYTGLGRSIGADSVGFVGAIQELPAISGYATIRPDRPVRPYIGVRAGLAQLTGFRSFTTINADTLAFFTADGTTMVLGAMLGANGYLTRGFSFVLEFGGFKRPFRSVNWSAPGGNRVPSKLPRSLSVNNWELTFGAQVTVP
jgi:hypothetical protein